MKKIYLLSGIVIIILIAVFYFTRSGDGKKPLVTNVDFSKKGVFVMNNPGMEKDVPFIIYDEPGKPAVTTKLKFDTESNCTAGGNTLPCLAMSTTFDMAFGGKSVLIEGTSSADGFVYIKKLEVIDEPKMEDGTENTTGGGQGILPYDSGVEGVVTIGPTCPVMREGDTSCADKAFVTTVQIIRVGSPKSSPFATVETDKNGKYKIMLPPGEYAVQPVGGKVFPSCGTKEVTIVPAKIQKIDISCDTGIR